jgi:hypothetical protein
MRVDRLTSKQRGKSYKSVLLRHAYRDENGKVKHKTLLNLAPYSEEEIDAIDWALQNKKEIHKIIANQLKRKYGKSFGAVYLISEIMKKLSIDKALGNTLDGKLAKFQVIARTISQGSRLSAIRMCENHAAFELLCIDETITEDDLYPNLSWLAKNQKAMELKLFKSRYRDKAPEIFLYDVTSSYFEGTKNYFADWGYDRDKKKGKLQVVAGLLCDESGYPLTISLFKGNTLDFNTVHTQILRLADDFGCKHVTLVGDRGMIKSKQIEELDAEDFYYITAITKPQIETLIKENVLQVSLFDKEVKEIEQDGIRYILKRNPVRTEEICLIRNQKKTKIEELCKLKNEYLKTHKRAKPETAIKKIQSKINKLKIDGWLNVVQSSENARILEIKEDLEKLAEVSKLDGCYVIKSNLPKVEKEIIHSRYKDLKFVEENFRSIKTSWLEVRPWYVRKEGSTRGHAFVVMLSYMVVKYLRDCWKHINLTVEEGIAILDSLNLLEVKLNGEIKYYEVPEPTDQMLELLKSAGVVLPPRN